MTVCASTTTPGLDVSGFQLDTNWSAVASSGRTFTFVKFSESHGYTNPLFARDWAAAKEAGLLRGAYHFAHFDVDGATQAAYFLAHVDKYGAGELPCVIDVEQGTTQKITDMDIIGQVVSDWIDAVTAATGKRPLVYVSTGFWRVPAHYGIEAKADLWVAAYPGNQPPEGGPWCVNVPAAWDTWKFWQHSPAGVVAGVQKPCDVDVFNGSLEDLRAYAGQAPLPAPSFAQAPVDAFRKAETTIASWPAYVRYGSLCGIAVLAGLLIFGLFPSED